MVWYFLCGSECIIFEDVCIFGDVYLVEQIWVFV